METSESEASLWERRFWWMLWVTIFVSIFLLVAIVILNVERSSHELETNACEAKIEALESFQLRFIEELRKKQGGTGITTEEKRVQPTE